MREELVISNDSFFCSTIIILRSLDTASIFFFFDFLEIYRARFPLNGNESGKQETISGAPVESCGDPKKQMSPRSGKWREIAAPELGQ